MSPTIKEIEDALITAIKAGMDYVRTVETYQGELDEKKISQFALNFPAVLIYMEANEYTHRTWPYMWHHPVFTFLICDRNLRSESSGRRGDNSAPGTYQMLSDLFDIVFNQTFDLEIDPFDIVKEEAVINATGFSVYAAQYKTKAARN